MRHISLLPFTVDVAPLAAELEAHPEVWDQIRLRTFHDKSPHREISDIWCRYNDLQNFQGNLAKFNGPHTSVWYPVIEKLPSVINLSHEVLERTDGERLAGILITRVPPGAKVYPHVDSGWHAENHIKIGVQVKGDHRQAFCFEDGELSAIDGEVYEFNNLVPHWVRNNSDRERITLIVTLRKTCH